MFRETLHRAFPRLQALAVIALLAITTAAGLAVEEFPAAALVEPPRGTRLEIRDPETGVSALEYQSGTASARRDAQTGQTNRQWTREATAAARGRRAERHEFFLQTTARLQRGLATQEVYDRLRRDSEHLLKRSPQTVFTVTESGDMPDTNLLDGLHSPATLRSAVQNANLTPEVDEIQFAVSSVLISSLYGAIVANTPVMVDGDLGGGDKVEIIGEVVGSMPTGLWFQNGGSVIRNLEMHSGNNSAIALLANGGNANVVQGCEIHNWEGPGINFNFSSNNLIGGLGLGEGNTIFNLTGTGGNGISMILTSNNNVIAGNYIGTPDGTTAAPNSRSGIFSESSFNRIANNLVSGNDWYGVYQSYGSDTARANVVELNLIGTTDDGLGALGNGGTSGYGGVQSSFRNSQDTVRNNVCSGNSGYGIGTGSVEVVIEDNIVGLDIDGATALPNGYGGISHSRSGVIRRNLVAGNTGVGISLGGNSRVIGNVIGADDPAKSTVGNLGVGINASGNGAMIGGPAPGERNIVSGNLGGGIRIVGATVKNVVVQDNFVGVDSLGNSAIANGSFGIGIVNGPDSNRIARNVVAGNAGHGIQVGGFANATTTFWAEGNLVYANLVGVGADGTTALGNGGHGINSFQSRGNEIGRADSGNVIVASDSSGIVLWNARQNFIYGNHVGTLVTGAAGYGNAGHGLLLVDADQNDIGGVATLRNVIVENDSCGLAIYSSSENVLVGNLVGVNETLEARGNGLQGILLVDSDSNAIGGSGSVAGNSIADHDSAGVAIYGTSRANTIVANSIGVVTDTLQPPIGNRIGILIEGGKLNHVGTEAAEIQNAIVGNFEAGVLIAADSNFVRNNFIALTINDDADPSGAGDGILIAGFDNRIGGGYSEATNTIINNAGTGVWVEYGEGNTIRGNLIHDNGLLGIDLIPAPGVTKNDSADTDAGANELQNFPIIDSARVFNQQTTVFGHVESTDDTAALMIEFFLTEDCDSSKYGEGDAFLDSLPVFAVFGRADFTHTFAQEFDSTSKLTMTATNARGSTSEYSGCWPAKVLELVDDYNEYIPGRSFEFSKMQHDIPVLTDTPLGEYSSDNQGLIYLGQEFVDEVDTLKISKLQWEQTSPKRPTILPVAYRVWLDNGKLDSSNSDLYFTELDSNYHQKVELSHTTIKFNLLTSIEWDVSRAYVDSLKQMFRYAANFLYDVGDGQLTLDSVMIVDEKLAWNSCDIRLRASNDQWPEAYTNGLMSPEPIKALYMPREHGGTRATNRFLSAINNPPRPSHSDMFRTVVHELGHYALGFYDEYIFPEPDTLRCSQIKNYGFMDKHYLGHEPNASEMSWNEQYQFASCRNTKQYIVNFTNCWTYLENKHEKEYDNILSPIIRPIERGVGSGVNSYFFGPNEFGVPTDYDVGSRVAFRETIPPQTGVNRVIRAADAVSHQPRGGLRVMHYRKQAGYVLEQGLTYDDGRLVLLGVQDDDVVYVSGPGYIVPPNPPLPPPPPKPIWSFGSFRAVDTGFVPISPYDTLPALRLPFGADDDEDPLGVPTIDSLVPIICAGAVNAGDFTIEFQAQSSLGGSPAVQMHSDEGTVAGHATVPNGSDYSATIGDDPGQAGVLFTWLQDPTIDSFFFAVDYVIEDVADTLEFVEFASFNGDAEISLRAVAGGFVRGLLFSTDYPVPYTGLSGELIPASRAQTLASYPAMSYDEGSEIAIAYDLSRFTPISRDELDPGTLAIYRWDESTEQWSEVGGRVDTTQSVIAAGIVSPGTYAVFATAKDEFSPPCGDADGSGQIDVTDAVYLITYIFGGGPAPIDEVAGDFDCSGQTDITDAVYMITYIFGGGPPPCATCE